MAQSDRSLETTLSNLNHTMGDFVLPEKSKKTAPVYLEDHDLHKRESALPKDVFIPVEDRGFLADSKKLKDFIICRKCKQEFDNEGHKPYLLPCLNAICQSCTRNIPTLEKQGLNCDGCHCLHFCFQNGDLSLQVDNTRKNASEILRLTNVKSSLVCEMCPSNEKASHRCIDCSLFIGEDCVKLHSSLKPFKLHTVLEIKGLLADENKCFSLFRSTTYCKENGHEEEPLKMYCLDSACVKPICIQCCITAHKNHSYCNIAEAGKESRSKIENLLKEVDLQVNQAQTSVTELQKINDTFLHDARQLQNEIKTRFNETKKALEHREKTLCDAVIAQMNDKQRCIEKEKTKTTSFINSCKHACYYGNISPKLNDHQPFLDIANSIQLQLENLQSQVIENQVTIDTIKFSPEPSDVCFTTSINNFGKILVTKVSPKKSKVDVSSPVCDQGQEVQFKIQLFSSTGLPVVDESVCVHLKQKGKILKSILCAIDSSSSSFTGIWTPDKPLQLFWIVWIVASNEIELDTLKGVLKVKDTRKKIPYDLSFKTLKCDICMAYPTNPKKLEKCGHTFCKECIDEYFQYKPDCPSCDNIQMKVTGDQPPGSISIEKTYTTGIYGGIIHVEFMFEDGYQGKEHPEPGKKYKGSTFSSYVHNNMKGRLVAKLLNVAFSRRLVFTIGHHGEITSNGIHHIAKLVYPGPTHMYLDKVLEELKDKGVTEESADDPEEYKEYSKRFNY